MTSPTTSADAVRVLQSLIDRDWILPEERPAFELAITTLSQQREAGAVAWRFYVTDDECRKPFWTAWSADRAMHEMMDRRGYAAVEYAHPAQAASQEGEKGVTVELVIPTPGAIKTFAHPASAIDQKSSETDSEKERQ